MNDKITRINRQLEQIEEQRKELLEKKRKEERERLIEIGRIVVKCTGAGIESVDKELLKKAMGTYYMPAYAEKTGTKGMETPKCLAEGESLTEGAENEKNNAEER